MNDIAQNATTFQALTEEAKALLEVDETRLAVEEWALQFFPEDKWDSTNSHWKSSEYAPIFLEVALLPQMIKVSLEERTKTGAGVNWQNEEWVKTLMLSYAEKQVNEIVSEVKEAVFNALLDTKYWIE